MMKRVGQLTVSMCVLLLVCLSADAALVLVDDFESYAVGTALNNQTAGGPLGGLWDADDEGGWHGTKAGAVIDQSGNKVVHIEYRHNNNRTLCVNGLADTIDAGESGILFFRFQAVNTTKPISLHAGFHALTGSDPLTAANKADLNNFKAGIRVVRFGNSGNFQIRKLNSSTPALVSGLKTNKWYGVWLDINRSKGTFDLYVREAPNGGGAPGLPGGVPNGTGLAFNGLGSEALTGAIWHQKGGNKSNIRIDEVWWSGSGGIVPERKATKPSPEDGGLVTETHDVELKWAPGAKAVMHDVFFSTDFNDVNDRAGAAFLGQFGQPSLTIANPTSPIYPDYLVPGETYYWCVDEVNDADVNSPWLGNVWSFLVDPNGTTPVPPQVDVWVNDVTETTASLFGQIISDGNDSCTGWMSIKGEFDTDWVIPAHQGMFATGDMFVENLKGLLPDTEYQFKASAQNVDGMHSTQAYTFRTLGTRPDLMIYKQPQSQRVTPGLPVELCMGLAAKDVDPALIQYMWFKKTPGALEETAVPGADNPCLTIAAASEADEGEYKCIAIVPGLGVATSNVVTITLERLMAHWKLDGNLSDSSGHAWDATMVGSAEDDPNAWALGAVGQAFYPRNKGTRRAIVHGSEDAFEFWKNGFTVSAWIKIQNGNGWSSVVTKQLRPNTKSWRGWVFNVSPDGKIELGIRGVKNFKAGSNINNFSWHHVAGTYCPKTRRIKLYIDGVRVGSSGLGTNLRGTDQPITIGAGTPDGKYNRFPGLIDEVRIHNYPLNHLQVRSLCVYDLYPELKP